MMTPMVMMMKGFSCALVVGCAGQINTTNCHSRPAASQYTLLQYFCNTNALVSTAQFLGNFGNSQYIFTILHQPRNMCLH